MSVKTLILNGSPRKGGDTAALVEAFRGALDGDTLVVSPAMDISPCIDCRRCKALPGCAVDDAMQQVYAYLEDCDAIALATPIWFSQMSGPLMNMASRLQTYFCARHFRGEPPRIRPKQSVLLLAGAQPGTEEGAIATCKTILKLVNALPVISIVRSMDTDRLPACMDTAALLAAREAAAALNGRREV